MFLVSEEIPQKWLQMRWVVSFKCVVKGYQECRFGVKDGEVFKVLKKIGEKGRAFRIANESGQLGHLQRELVVSTWPVNASMTWNRKGKGRTISEYARGNNDSFVLFCSVLLTFVDSL